MQIMPTPPDVEARGPDLDEIIETVLTTSRVFVAIAARSIAAIGLEVTLPQYRLLIVLAGHGPQSLGSLSESLTVSASTATRMCDRLIRKGLVRRRASSHDRREVRLALTAAGRRLVDETTQLRRMELSRLLDAVPTDDQRALIHALSSLNSAAGEPPDLGWASGWQ
jgi:DNA-binding MarR family transcriptional regulator